MSNSFKTWHTSTTKKEIWKRCLRLLSQRRRMSLKRSWDIRTLFLFLHLLILRKHSCPWMKARISKAPSAPTPKMFSTLRIMSLSSKGRSTILSEYSKLLLMAIKETTSTSVLMAFAQQWPLLGRPRVYASPHLQTKDGKVGIERRWEIVSACSLTWLTDTASKQGIISMEGFGALQIEALHLEMSNYGHASPCLVMRKCYHEWLLMASRFQVRWVKSTRLLRTPS